MFRFIKKIFSSGKPDADSSTNETANEQLGLEMEQKQESSIEKRIPEKNTDDSQGAGAKQPPLVSWKKVTVSETEAKDAKRESTRVLVRAFSQKTIDPIERKSAKLESKPVSVTPEALPEEPKVESAPSDKVEPEVQGERLPKGLTQKKTIIVNNVAGKKFALYNSFEGDEKEAQEEFIKAYSNFELIETTKDNKKRNKVKPFGGKNGIFRVAREILSESKDANGNTVYQYGEFVGVKKTRITEDDRDPPAERLQSARKEVKLFALLKEDGNYPALQTLFPEMYAAVQTKNGRQQDVVYAFMEIVPGQNGKSLIQQFNKDGKKIPEDQLIQITQNLSKAVDLLHNNLLYHRDIKPENIIVTDDNQVKLIDFGSAVYFRNTGDEDLDTFVVSKKTDPRGFSPQWVFYGDPDVLNFDNWQTALTILRLAGANLTALDECHKEAYQHRELYDKNANPTEKENWDRIATELRSRFSILLNQAVYETEMPKPVKVAVLSWLDFRSGLTSKLLDDLTAEKKTNLLFEAIHKTKHPYFYGFITPNNTQVWRNHDLKHEDVLLSDSYADRPKVITLDEADLRYASPNMFLDNAYDDQLPTWSLAVTLLELHGVDLTAYWDKINVILKHHEEMQSITNKIYEQQKKFDDFSQLLIERDAEKTTLNTLTAELRPLLTDIIEKTDKKILSDNLRNMVSDLLSPYARSETVLRATENYLKAAPQETISDEEKSLEDLSQDESNISKKDEEFIIEQLAEPTLTEEEKLLLEKFEAEQREAEAARRQEDELAKRENERKSAEKMTITPKPSGTEVPASQTVKDERRALLEQWKETSRVVAQMRKDISTLLSLYQPPAMEKAKENPKLKI